MEFLNLTPEQEQVYFTLLSLGQSSPSELAKYVNMDSEKIRQIFEELESNQFVMPLKGIGDRYVAIYPFKKLAEKSFHSARELNESLNQLNEKISEQLSRISTITQEQQEQLRNAITQAIEEKEKLLTETKEQVGKELTDNTNLLDSKKSELEQRVQQLKRASQEQARQVQSQTDQVIKELSSLKDEKSQDVEETLKNEGQNTINQLKSEIPRVITSSVQKVDEILDDAASRVQDTGNQLEEFTNELSSLTLKLIEDQLSGIIEETETQLNLAGNSLETQVTEFSGLITNKSQNLQRMLGDALNSFKHQASSTTSRLSDEWVANIKRQKQSHQQQLDSRFNELERNMQAKFNELRVQITKFTTDLEQMILEEIKHVSKQSLEQADQFESEFTDSIMKGKDVLVDNMNSTVDTSMQNIATTISSFQEDWTRSITQWKTVLDSVKGDAIKKAKDQLDARKIIARNDISSLKSESITKIKEHVQAVLHETTSLKERTKELQEQSVSRLEELLQNFQQTLEQASKQAREDIQSTLEIAMQHVTSSTKALSELLEQQMNDLFSSTLDPLITTHYEVLKAMEEVKKNMERRQQELSDKMQQALEQLSDSLQSTLGAQLEELGQQLHEFTTYFESGTSQITSVLNDMFQSLSDLDSKFQAFAKPQLSTITLIGRKAIMDHIIGLMDRVAFSRMTLLVPNIHDLPVDKIISHKKARFIRLYSYVNINADREPLQRLLKAGVQVFKIPSTDEKWKGNIITNAGDAEAVWAVYDPINPEDAMGLASSSDAFISVIVGLVIQSLLSHREQVREQDVGL